jgi:hypothetical protein
MRRYGVVEVYLHSFIVSTFYVGGQFHDLTYFAPGKKRCQLDMGLVSQKIGLRVVEIRKKRSSSKQSVIQVYETYKKKKDTV